MHLEKNKYIKNGFSSRKIFEIDDGSLAEVLSRNLR